jgi:DNA-binding NarL/FixJ family response regulator
MLVDDHDIVRTGLRAFLETQEDLEIVAEAGSGSEAVDQVLATNPDVVVMDIAMPDMDGLEATRRLKALAPQCQILALTIHGSKEYFFAMLSAGATGYLTKQAAADELVAAIRAVAIGNVYLQPVLAHWLLDDYRRLVSRVSAFPQEETDSSRREEGLDVLSKRELQVLELVAQGKTNSNIGENLGISPKTVARHRERIMKKLKLHSTTGLVKFAIRAGLISVDE